MPFDYQLIAGSLLVLFGLVGTINAYSDRRWPIVGLIVLLIGGGFLGWAWTIAEGQLVWTDLPDAIFRLIATFL
ncbi:MAG: hypothetical protein AAF393_10190 [Pseudomonadota bacterium]